MTDSHDAASTVARMAGLDTEQRKPLTPEHLIGRYCTNVPDGLVAGSGQTTRDDGSTVARGFCGFSGYMTRADGARAAIGYDDGYDFMGDLESRGWRALASKGDWPYVVYVVWARDGLYAIAEYCEADLTVWTFTDKAAAQAHVATLRDCP